jgi:acyl-CoA synthetase (AMP-forming)/AMP-acid ligase II
MTIPALLARAAARHGGRPAVVDGDVALTWSELHGAARDVAAGLVDAGIAPGDRVAMWAPNGWRWIVAVHGVFMAGATLVPINTRFKGAEAAVILERSGAALLLSTRTFLDTDYVAMLDGLWSGPTALLEEPLTGSDDDRLEVDRRAAALTDDDVSDILFTSGTTGVPKGVVMTHGRTLRVAVDWATMTGLTADDRYLMVNPYFHMFGLKAGILTCTAVGATMLPHPVFDAGAVLERVERERITVLPGAPTIYQALLDHPARGSHDLSSLRVAVTGAADIPVELIRRIRDELPFEFVLAGYGLTEAGTATGTTPADDPAVTATTVGRPRPGFDVKIVDGEVVLRGPSVMLGYLDDPAATAAVLDADGWLRTGDLGVVDDDGNLRIVGRLKDMFIVGGFNAYPAEIENALLRHPSIQQAAVIGVPDERLGEVGMAFVVTASGDRAEADAIVAWAKGEMANYKVPRVVRVVDALPINATGKVVKDELRAMV